MYQSFREGWASVSLCQACLLRLQMPAGSELSPLLELASLSRTGNINSREADRRALQKEIRKTKAKTDGIIGVNVMVALSDFDDLVQCAVDEAADILFLGAGTSP